MSDNSSNSTSTYFSSSQPVLTSSYTPLVDANGNFSKGVCPNADALKTIYAEGLISKPDCVERCATAVTECNAAVGTNVSRVQTCNYSVCEKVQTATETPTQISIRPHSDQCKAGKYCKECCIGKCLVDDQTLNMTCFLKCIDDVCTERVTGPTTTTTSSYPSSTGIGNSQPSGTPDVMIPISVPVELNPKKKSKSSEGLWIFLIVVFGLMLLGLGIVVVRNKRFYKFLHRHSGGSHVGAGSRHIGGSHVGGGRKSLLGSLRLPKRAMD